MDAKEERLRGFAAIGHYSLFSRQALRFVIEIGGPEALDRFEEIVRPMIANTPDLGGDLDKVRDFALEMIDKDLKTVRESPDMI